MRHRIAQRLHGLGVHLMCREWTERVEPIKPLAYVLDDGTTWTPDFNGILPFSTRQWHY